MPSPMRASLLLAIVLLVCTSTANAGGVAVGFPLGPTPYRGFGDSLFQDLDFGCFHLEDFEEPCADPLNLCEPGVTISAGAALQTPGPSTDSVDEDVDGINGTGVAGHSIFRGGGPTAQIQFTFSPDPTCNELPTHVGLVWTDGTPASSVSFEVYGPGNVLIARETEVLGDAVFTGTTDEDRFFGYVDLGGIESIVITDNGAPNNIEVDHLQWGYQPDFLFMQTSYRQFSAHSPFSGLTFGYFHLEDFETDCGDPAGLNLCVPGVTITPGPFLQTPGLVADSVDEDGGLDGSGQDGHSLSRGGGPTAFHEFTFDDTGTDLDTLPTHVGIVFTDSTQDSIVTLQAFDRNGVSIGGVSSIVGDAFFTGQVNEDRFFGVVYPDGISRIRMDDGGAPNDLEVDHLQFGAVAQIISEQPYLEFADSPYSRQPLGYFHLEDFEDASLNSPGLSSPAGSIQFPSPITDSVDEDDGVVDGFGTGGHDYFAGTTTVFDFDEVALGELPTHVGIAYTDSTQNATITFEAFDPSGDSLGISSATLGDGSFNGETAEDRFFGAIYAGGISRISLTDNGAANDLEVDHVQYGVLPEPAVTLQLTAGVLTLLALARRRSR